MKGSMLKTSDFPSLPSPIGRYRDVVKEVCKDELSEHVLNWYRALAKRQGEAREQERHAVDNEAAWRCEAERIRRDFQAAIGPFPQHEVETIEIGLIERPGVRIYKILYSAAPDNWIPANVYIPRNVTAPIPAIVVPCGHGSTGKTGYVERALKLALNGYAVITFDFIGTGERQLVSPKTASISVSTQHNIQGSKLPLAGCSLGWFMLQETLAAVTVLQQRPEVDPERIGITGGSGGGWTSVHAAALDPRIKVVIPAASVCSFRFDVQPDDAEQMMFGMERKGLHYPDLISFLICPRPMFIVANSHDIWGIEGTRHAFDEAMRSYKLHGVPEQLNMQVWDKGHAYQDDQLEVAIAWFNTWLKGDPDASVTLAVLDENRISPEEHALFPQGTLFEAGYPCPNRVFAHFMDSPEFKKSCTENRESPPDFLKGLSQPSQTVNWLELDRFVPGSGRGRRIVFESEEGLLLPAEILIPDEPRGITILVDDSDRRTDLEWQIESMASGQITVRPDLRGWGETETSSSWSDWEGWAANLYSNRRYRLFALARLTGRNLVLDRAKDLLSLVNVVAELFPGQEISLWGRQQGALPALYAAIADERIRTLTLEKSLRSYRDLMECDLPLWHSEGNVERILCYGLDLPELYKAFKGKLILKEPLDAALRPVSQ